jgi:hypothetical protein
MLRDGLDPRTEFNAEHMRPPKRPVAMEPVECRPDQATVEAIERLRTLTLPLLCRVPVDETIRAKMLAMLEKIEKERSAEVIDVLADICAKVFVGCLSIGIDDLIEAKTRQQ